MICVKLRVACEGGISHIDHSQLTMSKKLECMGLFCLYHIFTSNKNIGLVFEHIILSVLIHYKLILDERTPQLQSTDLRDGFP